MAICVECKHCNYDKLVCLASPVSYPTRVNPVTGEKEYLLFTVFGAEHWESNSDNAAYWGDAGRGFKSCFTINQNGDCTLFAPATFWQKLWRGKV